MRFWVWSVAVAVDQLANALIGGWPDETWSARCWREKRWKWVAFLDFIEPDHCKLSFEAEQYRRHSPVEER